MPLVVRLEGTNVEKGKEILAEVGPAHRLRKRSRRCRAEDRPGRPRARVIPQLQTERLLLRGLRQEDFEAYARFHADPK